jgi:hypothetical protein
MRRLFAVLLSLVLAAPFASPQQSQQNVSALVKSTVDSVVLIVVSDQSGKPVAEGSGFIVSADGKIATNHHVIQGAQSAMVKLNNGAFLPVDGILADDPDRDIAILKVSGKGLPALPLADSDRISVGDHVVAIGSPLGLQNSVSDGIVSAIREDAKGRRWIQTTAAASHGNSGGPLLTMQGKVVGLLTMKLSEGENLNFAVPSKLLSPLLLRSEVVPFGTVPKFVSGTPLLAGDKARILVQAKTSAVIIEATKTIPCGDGSEGCFITDTGAVDIIRRQIDKSMLWQDLPEVSATRADILLKFTTRNRDWLQLCAYGPESNEELWCDYRSPVVALDNDASREIAHFLEPYRRAWSQEEQRKEQRNQWEQRWRSDLAARCAPELTKPEANWPKGCVELVQHCKQYVGLPLYSVPIDCPSQFLLMLSGK